jgi:hypothetical protein
VGLGPAGSASANLSEHVDYELQAEHFQCLAKGGPQAGWAAEAIVYQGGATFCGSSRPYLRVRLSQRPNAL